MRRAVYPGSFDPVTNGHLDIITRGAALVDELIVAVVLNPSKTPLFTLEERQEILTKTVSGLPNVKIDAFSGLLVDFVRQRHATIILKGLRAVSDFEFEFQMALLNRNLAPEVDTIFLMTADQHDFLSSSSIKEIAKLGGTVARMVPSFVELKLKEKFATPEAVGQKVERE